MESAHFERFKELLDSQHEWPCDYLFKFIVGKDWIERAIALFEGNKISFKKSETGKYISVSSTLKMQSSDEVVEIYKKAAEIPGVIAL